MSAPAPDLQSENDIITELNHAQWLALENVRLLAARHRKEEWAQSMLRFVDEAETNKAQIYRRLDAAFPSDTSQGVSEADGREAFEKWCTSVRKLSVKRMPDGAYLYLETRHAWFGWLESRAALRSEPGVSNGRGRCLTCGEPCIECGRGAQS